jgi:integrase
MPTAREIDLRNRAVVAFSLSTGVRDGAVISLKLKHVDLGTDTVSHDARDVKAKFSKTFVSHFFPVGDEIRQIVEE